MDTQYPYLKPKSCQDALNSWWLSLAEHRGERAQLRRAERPEDILLTEAFFRFLRAPGLAEQWSKPYHLLDSAMVAALLAKVKKQPGKADMAFAEQLATPISSGGKKPPLSELRFRQLQKSRTENEFFTRMTRAIQILDGQVNILSLADSTLHWCHEYRQGKDRKPQKRLAVRWAADYYRALPNSQ